MQELTFLALGKWEAPGRFNAQCGRCLNPVGTFNGLGLLRAIERTSTKGGILCPSCRQESCHYCGMPMAGSSMEGQEFAEFGELPTDKYQYGRMSDWFYVCGMCWCETWEALQRKTDVTLACPVLHNRPTGPTNE